LHRTAKKENPQVLANPEVGISDDPNYTLTMFLGHGRQESIGRTLDRTGSDYQDNGNDPLRQGQKYEICDDRAESPSEGDRHGSNPELL
jgi:hypothetical protein